jgi:hypothetical protein
MKKVLLSLLAVAALVLSCQNYDDEFAALNSKVASLESQISSLAGLQTALTQVQSSVSALQAAVSAIPNLSSEVAAILADLSDLETAVSGATTAADLDALKAELNTTLAALQALIEANSTSIASIIANNADLKAELDALGLDIDSLLANEDPYQGNIIITDASELAFAKSLGTKVKGVKGDVTITLSTANGLTAADVAPVTSLIESVIGNVVITTNASIDLSALKTVSGLYEVRGKDINDAALTSVGDMYLAYDGPVSFPSLTAAKKIFFVNYATSSTVTGTTSIDFSNVIASSVTTASSAASGHTSGGSLDLTGMTEGFIDAQDATSIKIGDATVIRVDSKDATEIHLGFDGTLASLDINDTEATAASQKLAKVFVHATKITGTADVDMLATGELHLPNLTQVNVLTSDALVHDLSKLVYLGTGSDTTTSPFVGTSSTLTLSSATSVSLPVLKKAGDMTLSKVTSISLPALTEGDVLTADLATSISAPLATFESVEAKPATATSSTSIEIKNLVDAAGNGIGAIINQDKVTSLTINALSRSITVDDASSFMETLVITGASNAVGVTTGSNMAKLKSVTLGGKLGTAEITTSDITTATALTSIVTSGTIQYLYVHDNGDLTTLTMDHTEDVANGGYLSIVNNDKLASFTTKINKVRWFVVTGNAVLTSFDASSMTALPNNSTTSTGYVIDVSGNADTVNNASGTLTLAKRTGLQGSYVAASATTAEAFTQASLATLKPYMQALAAASVTATAKTAAAVGAKGTVGSLTTTFIYANYEYQPSSASAAALVAEIGTASPAATTSAVVTDITKLN